MARFVHEVFASLLTHTSLAVPLNHLNIVMQAGTPVISGDNDVNIQQLVSSVHLEDEQLAIALRLLPAWRTWRDSPTMKTSPLMICKHHLLENCYAVWH